MRKPKCHEGSGPGGPSGTFRRPPTITGGGLLDWLPNRRLTTLLNKDNGLTKTSANKKQTESNHATNMTTTLTVPEQMQLAAKQKPALVAQLVASEAWLVKTFGIPIKYRYAPNWKFMSAWQSDSVKHEFHFTAGGTLDDFLWEWSCFLSILTLQGQAVKTHGWLPYVGSLPFEKVRELHFKHGFRKIAMSLCRQEGSELEAVVGNQFLLINQIPQVLGRTIFHMSLAVRIARDFTEISRHGSPASPIDWHPVAGPQFADMITELAPAKIAVRLWSVKVALDLLTDRLNGTRGEDRLAGFGDGALVRTITDYYQAALEKMPPGVEYEMMRRVSHLAGLQEFENAKKLHVNDNSRAR